MDGADIRVEGEVGRPDRTIEFLVDATGARLDRKRLAEANARFDQLLQHSSDAIMVVNSGVVLYASPSLTAVSGITPASAVGSSLRNLFHPDDISEIEVMFAEVEAQAGTARSFVARLGHVDGGWRDVEATASNHAGNPAIAGIVLNMHDVTQHIEEFRGLARRVNHDELTGLPNRTLLLERLLQALSRSARSGRPCAVLFIDLDRFKQVNDAFGHAAGDVVLITTATRLASAIRPGDSAARLGGEEFVVLIENVDGRDGALASAERIRTGVAEPIVLAGGYTLTVTCSIGVAVSATLAADSLLHEADVALYRAKERGRNRSEIYDEGDGRDGSP